MEGRRSDKMLLRNMVLPCLDPHSGTRSKRTPSVLSTRQVLATCTGSGSSNTMPTRLRRVRGQVSFDPAKESVHIVSHAQPHGDPFKLLGVTFDSKLRMDLCVRETVNQASWMLTTILRTRRFHEFMRLVSSVQIEDALVCGVAHPCCVPRGENHTGWNRCSSEALPSRLQSHRRRHPPTRAVRLNTFPCLSSACRGA